MFRKIARSVRKRISRTEVCGQQPAASGNEAGTLSSDRQNDIAVLINSHKISGSGAAEAFSVGLEARERGAALDEAYCQCRLTHRSEDYPTKSACSVNDHSTHSDTTALPPIEDMFISDCSDISPVDSEPIVDSFTLGAMWNAFTWINKLPDEVLVTILLSVRLRSWRDSKLPDVNPILYMRVCRHWRDVILNHGCFWNPIVVRKRTAGLQLALSRSQQMPLHLTFHEVPTLIQMLPFLAPFRGRMEVLVLKRGASLLEPIAAPSSLFQDTFPRLKKLVVKDQDLLLCLGSSTNDDPVFLSANFPLLTHVELERVQVQLNASLFQRLTALTLVRCTPYPSRMYANTFLDALQHGQHLTELVLTYFMAAACSHLPSRSRRPFSLPRLRKLTMHDTAQWVREFTTFVLLPNSGEVELVGMLSDRNINDPGPHVDLWNFMIPPQFSGMPLIAQSRRVSVGATWTDHSLYYYDGPVTVCLRLRAPPRGRAFPTRPATILATTRTLLRPSSALSDLSLDLDLVKTTRADFDLLFETFAQLESLSMMPPLPLEIRKADVLFPPCVLQSLSTSSDETDPGAGDTSQVGQARVRCPRLKKLSLVQYGWNDGAIAAMVLDCLRARAARGAPKLEELEIRVKPHTKFGKGRLDGRYATELQELVSGTYTFAVGKFGNS